MISGASASHIPMPSYYSSTGLSEAAKAVPETILSPSQTVQENSLPAPLPDADNEAEKPIISLSVSLVTTLQGQEDGISEAQTKPPKTEQPPEKVPSGTEKSDSGTNEAEEAQIKGLKERDTEVRAHEQAHAAAGGQYASSPTYDYETGPNNQRYAIGGEVQIDTAPIAGDPSATIAKMNIVRNAALAPAEPSSQDRAVAALAAKRIGEAQAELSAQVQTDASGGPISTDDTSSSDPEKTTTVSTGSGSFQPYSTGTEQPDSASNIINIIS